MKKLLFATVLLACVSLFSQTPPVIRNEFTTNSNPAARNVVTNIVTSLVGGISNSLTSGSFSVNMDQAVNLSRQVNSNTMIVLGSMGDSVGGAKMDQWVPALWSAFGTNGGAMFGGVDNSFYFGVSGATNMLPTSDSRATNWFVNYYDFGPTDVQSWNGYSAGNVYLDTIQIAFISGTSGGGIVQTSVLGGAWGNVATITNSASYRGVLTNIAVPVGHYRFRYTNTVGRMSVLGGGYKVSSGVGIYSASMSEGGIDWSHIQRVSTNVLTPIIGGLGLGALLVEEKSGSTNWGDYGLSTLDVLRVQPLANSDLILIGTTPLSNSTLNAVLTIPQNTLARSYALTNSVLYFDGYSPFTAGDIIRLDTSFDGTHPPAFVQSILSGLLAEQSGIYEQAGYVRDIRGVRPTLGQPYAVTNTANAFAGIQVFNDWIRVQGASANYDLASRSEYPANPNARTLLVRDTGFKLGFYDVDSPGYIWYMGVKNGFNTFYGTHLFNQIGSSDTQMYSIWTQHHQATNGYNFGPLALGPNSNVVLTVSNSSASGPGVLHFLRTTNGVPVGGSVLSINLTNGNVGVGTAAPSVPLQVAGAITASGAGSVSALTLAASATSDTITFASGTGPGIASVAARQLSIYGSGFNTLDSITTGQRTSNFVALVTSSNTPPVFDLRDGTLSNAIPIRGGSSMGRTNEPLQIVSGAFPNATTVASFATNGALRLFSSTITPTAAQVGANNGWLQVSNGVLYFFSTTDGSTLTTVKIGPP
jgi:hypothetical protein